MKAGKMNNMAGKQSNPVQTKAMKQAHEGSILQAYKKGTAQLATAEEEEPLQGKFETTQLAELGEEDEEPSQLKENDTGLPDNLKSGVENLSGHSLDDVKVHYNSGKPSQLQAHAYAQGTDIHVAPGQEKHLPHEAWHVAQQKQGRVQPTKQLKGTSINDDVSLENEADVMGAKAIQMKSNVAQLHQHEARMKDRRNKKRVLKRAISDIYSKGDDSGPANVAQIGVHDRVLHAGGHNPNRNITVEKLVEDIRNKIKEFSDLNKEDSDDPGE